jgi:hypothetical protein
MFPPLLSDAEIARELSAADGDHETAAAQLALLYDRKLRQKNASKHAKDEWLKPAAAGSAGAAAAGRSNNASAPAAPNEWLSDEGWQDSEEFAAIKRAIVSRYSYAPNYKKITSRPHVALEDAAAARKVRFLGNQIVATNGEKYTIVKTEKDIEDEVRMRAVAARAGPLKIIRTKKRGGVGHKFV